MTKQKVLVLMLAVLFALSATAFAVMPGTQAAIPTDAHSLAALTFKVGPSFNPPVCPDPGSCGCGGGGC